jgi:hypothetical protein
MIKMASHDTKTVFVNKEKLRLQSNKVIVRGDACGE